MQWRRQIRMEVAEDSAESSFGRQFAAMHCARDSWGKPQPYGGYSSGSDSDDETPEKRAMASWTFRKPMPASQPSELPAEASEWLPLPDPVAPSSLEVKQALWQRNELDRVSSTPIGGDDSVHGGAAVSESEPGTVPGSASRSQTPVLEAASVPDDDDREPRLVLPALESLISLRRDRVVPSQPSPKLLKSQVSGVGADAAPTPPAPMGNGHVNGIAPTSKPPLRRTISTASLKAAPIPRAPDLVGTASISASQLGGLAAVPGASGGAAGAAGGGVLPKPAPQSFNKFPGLWRATRKWGTSLLAGTSSAPNPGTGLPGPAASASSSGGGEAAGELLLPAASSQSFTAGYSSRSGAPFPQPQPPPQPALPPGTFASNYQQPQAGQPSDMVPSPASPAITAGASGAGPVSVSGAQPRLLRFSPRPARRPPVKSPTDLGGGFSRGSDNSAYDSGWGAGECVDSVGSPPQQQQQLEQLRLWQEWRRVAGPIQSTSQLGGVNEDENDDGDGDGGGGDGDGGGSAQAAAGSRAGGAPGIGPAAAPLWLNAGASPKAGGPLSDAAWIASAAPRGVNSGGGGGNGGDGGGGGCDLAAAGGASRLCSRAPSFTAPRGAPGFGRLTSFQRRMQVMSTGQLILPADFDSEVIAAAAAAAAMLRPPAGAGTDASATGDGSGYEAAAAQALDWSPSLGSRGRPLPGRTASFTSASADGRLALGWSPSMFGPAAASPPTAAGPSRLGPQPPQLAPTPTPPQGGTPLPTPPSPRPPPARQPSRTALRPTGRGSLDVPPAGPPASSRASLDSQRPATGTARFSFEARGTPAMPPSPQHLALASSQPSSPSPSQPQLPPSEARQRVKRQDSFSLSNQGPGQGPGQGQAQGQGQRPGQLMVTNSFRARRPDPAMWPETVPGLLPS